MKVQTNAFFGLSIEKIMALRIARVVSWIIGRHKGSVEGLVAVVYEGARIR